MQAELRNPEGEGPKEEGEEDEEKVGVSEAEQTGQTTKNGEETQETM